MGSVIEPVEPRPWAQRAACRPFNPEIFFPPIGNSAHQVAYAKRICASCPVRTECLEMALARPHLYEEGIYGGLQADERRSIVRARRYQRRRAAQLQMIQEAAQDEASYG